MSELERLERATSPGARGALDGDSALAESWRAFSQLLADAEPVLNEDLFVVQLRRRLAAERRRRGLLVACAAGVLVALGTVAHFAPRPESRLAGANAAAVSPWHDELADAAAQTAAEFSTVEYGWREQPDEADWVRDWLDEFENELNQTPL